MQQPRILATPPAYSHASATEALDLAASHGLILDPWQQLAIHHGLAEDRHGAWQSFEVAEVVARQNGKGCVFEARELAGLYLFGERLIVHSAHRFDTSLEAFLRMLILLESNPDLERKIRRVSRSHGEEGIELKTGQRLRYKTRTASGGRGFSAPVIVLDEAMYLPSASMRALMFVMSAQKNPQLWYGASAVDVKEHEHGETLTRVRNRGLAGGDPSLTYMEYSPEATMADVEAGRVDLADPDIQAQGNPAAGIRIPWAHIEKERRSMTPREFAVERLGIGDWPVLDDEGVRLFSAEVLAGCVDLLSAPLDPIAIGVSMTPDRSRTCIAIAGRRGDGRIHGEVVDDQMGTKLAVAKVLALVTRWDPCAVVIDSADAAATLKIDLAVHDIEPELTTTREFALACGGIYDDVTDDQFRYRGEDVLTGAFEHAAKKAIGGAWVWPRVGVGYSAPLIAVSLARHGVLVHGRAKPAPATPRQAGASVEQHVDTADLTQVGF